MTDRTIVYRDLLAIKLAPRNPKAHDVATIGGSIRRHGLIELMTEDDRTGQLISGHGRYDDLLAKWTADPTRPPEGVRLRDDGGWDVPVVTGWASSDDAEAKAALIVLNQATIAGGWNPHLPELLAELLEHDVSPTTLGFPTDDVDRLIADTLGRQASPPATSSDDPPAEAMDDTTPPISQRGDIWLLGPHRIMCGDCRNSADVAAVVAGATLALAFTSPPYAEQRVYDAESGFEPIPPDEYVAWFRPVADNVRAHLAVDGSWFVNIKPAADGLDTELYVLDLVIAHAREWGWHFATEFCWPRPGMPLEPRRRFKNGFEPVYQFALNEWKFRPDAVRHESDAAIVPLGPGAGDTSWAPRTTMSNAAAQGSPDYAWFNDRHISGLAYPSNRLPTFTGTHEAVGHGAAFPVGLPEWFMRAYTDPGDHVFDPFMGSGSTLLAAEHQQRVAHGLEISARYTDMILRRWQRHTGIVPVREHDGAEVSFL